MLVLAGWAWAGIVSGGPKLVCEESVHDFGERGEAETVEHVFRVRNEGDQPLELLEARVSCGCMTGRLSERTLSPGAGADVAVTFRLKGRSGPQHQRLHLRSTDPDRRDFRLTLVGRVRADLSLQPPMVFFGNLSSGSERSEAADLVVRSNLTVRILNVSCPASWIEAVREAGEGGGERIRLRTRPPLPLGLLHTVVELRTDAPEMPVLKLPVGAHVRPESDVGLKRSE
jgi:hypothetical protein